MGCVHGWYQGWYRVNLGLASGESRVGTGVGVESKFRSCVLVWKGCMAYLAVLVQLGMLLGCWSRVG